MKHKTFLITLLSILLLIPSTKALDYDNPESVEYINTGISVFFLVELNVSQNIEIFVNLLNYLTKNIWSFNQLRL